VRSHDFPGMDTLAYVKGKTARHFFAATNVSLKGIDQVTAEQGQRQATWTGR
jgi:hypothetical protein